MADSFDRPRDVWALIAAGGASVRFGGETPKQFFELEGVPLFIHSVLKFARYRETLGITVIAPEKSLKFAEKAFGAHKADTAGVTVDFICGGTTRRRSVFNGVQHIINNKDVRIVLVHDAARPFVTEGLIAKTADAARKYGAAIPCVKIADAVKLWELKDYGETAGGIYIARKTLDRETLVLAQTPQGFSFDILKRAHEAADRDGYDGYDDASLAERIGVYPVIIDGERENKKITVREDL